jgi:hypothetical protein
MSNIKYNFQHSAFSIQHSAFTVICVRIYLVDETYKVLRIFTKLFIANEAD